MWNLAVRSQCATMTAKNEISELPPARPFQCGFRRVAILTVLAVVRRVC